MVRGGAHRCQGSTAVPCCVAAGRLAPTVQARPGRPPGWHAQRRPHVTTQAPTADAAAPRAAGIATTAASPEWKAPVRAVTETALAVCDDPVTITFKVSC